ncbi:MAG: hypothetical protein GY811_06660 [Myxococcales bacterium]|nr:hypothetical protein [Myxococcales bacterium]
MFFPLSFSRVSSLFFCGLLLACGAADIEGGGDVDAGPEIEVDGGALCGAVTCEAEEMCLDERCVAECADTSGLCGTSDELCCGEQEVCLQESCVPLGEGCDFTEECEIGEICEPTLGRCIPRDAVAVCEFVPPVGVLEPEVACRWFPEAADPYPDSSDVVMSPTVMNLSDDNGDGDTNAQDIPDIVFASFNRDQGCCTATAVIRVVSGACNADGSMNLLATVGIPFIDNSGGIALGNLHAQADTTERAPEIVATMRVGSVAYRRTSDDGTAWEELWRNETLPSAAHSLGGAQPSLADLNSDGRPEVIIGNIVLDGLTGVKIWDGLETVGVAAGIGNNAFLGPVSTAADLDLDGTPEVIAGNTVYDGVTGAEVWSFAYQGSASACQGTLDCDGYTAVGNFDADDQGEVVIVRAGEVFVLNHDGSLLHQVVLPDDNCSRNESGPPTIADFDGDGRAEIGTAGADFYIVIDFDCVGDPLPDGCESENILWTAANEDCSSRATGSSVFDFDGNGSAEVVYADETTFRLFDGRDGTVIYEDPTHLSNTRLEMPIVVDVDNDGKSEIIVPEPNNTSNSLGGIEVWDDASNNWVRTRRVWNQHSYHVTNISEDGQVPSQELANWLNPRLNNFRQNVQPDGLFDAPDLEIAAASGTCQTNGEQEVEVVVSNSGSLGVVAGIDIFVEILVNGAVIDSGTLQTTIPLLAGQQETLFYSFTPPSGDFSVRVTVDDDGTGAAQYNECDEDNNQGGADVPACGGID